MITRFHDEYDYMICLAACAVRRLAPAELPDGLSFDAVYRAAMEHDMAALCFCSVEKLTVLPDRPLCEKWFDRRGLALVREVNQAVAADEIRGVFAGNSVSFSEYQGTRLKELYPSPDLRTMSDVDFKLDSRDLNTASSLLEELGYSVHTEENGSTVVARREPDLNVELHARFFPSDPAYEKAFVSSGLTGTPALYLFTLLHLAKHYRSGGCGVRRFLDIYLLETSFPEVRGTPEVRRALKEAGEDALADTVSLISEYWFGDGERDPSFDGIAGYVKRSGTHGSYDNLIANRIAESGGKARYFFRRAFPARKALANTYPALSDHPARYPVYCAKRLIAKRKTGISELKVIKEKKTKK